MRRVRMWTLLFAAALAAGCSASRRPYANDPLLRGGRGIAGDPARPAVADLPPPVEPQAPHAPASSAVAAM